MRHVARATKASDELIANMRQKAEQHLQARIERYLVESGMPESAFTRDELLDIVTGEVRKEIRNPKRSRSRAA
jgi:hypothetical protein